MKRNDSPTCRSPRARLRNRSTVLVKTEPDSNIIERSAASASNGMVE